MYFTFQKKPYIAIIGDIKVSKKIVPRNEVQVRLATVLSGINQKYADDIASNFMITLGDEFQGLLLSGAAAMPILLEIEREMHPVKIRFGVGMGDISTQINREMAIGADGPGYYRARSALEWLKKNDKKKQATEADIRVDAGEENTETVEMVNTILSLMATIKSIWTERQKEVIWNFLQHSDNQVGVATRLGIKQSSVQKHLSNGKFYAYRKAIITVDAAFREI